MAPKKKIKTDAFTKQNVSWNEYMIQRYVYEQHVVKVPKVLSYDETTKTLVMTKIPQMCIADMYGDSPENTPTHLFEEVRAILTNLRDIGINYPDISPYNFIEHNDQVWIIDFGHASIVSKQYNPFMVKFIEEGHNGWNPEYK